MAIIKAALPLTLLALFLLSPILAFSYNVPDPKLQQCVQSCTLKRFSLERQQEFIEQCKKQYGGEQGSYAQEQEQQQQDENPYVFRNEHFKYKIKNEQGDVSVTQSFSKRSNLLRGLENYRYALLRVNPNTYMLPIHVNTDTLNVVLDGQGAVTVLHENNRQTFNLRPGDIFLTNAGSTVSIINKDNKERLYIAQLLISVFNPGNFEGFFGPGGKNPESFYNAFSDEIIDAAFNAKNAKRIFQNQNKGAFVVASPEQIQALTRDASSFQHPDNIFDKPPAFCNDYGHLSQVDQNDFKELGILQLAISFINITRGAMHGPLHNSRATSICVGVKGKGNIQMASPHLSSQQGQGQQGEGQQGKGQQGSSPSYMRVSAQVSEGEVFIVPVGHPFVAVAPRDENFQVLCFEINAVNNKKYPLAGKNNIYRQMEKEAKELACDRPSSQVDQVLNKQVLSWFYPSASSKNTGVVLPSR